MERCRTDGFAPKSRTVVEAREAKGRVETHAEFWRRVDDQLVVDEAELRREQSWVSEATEASLTELDEHLASLPVEEHEAALEGIKAYQREVFDSDFVAGWGRYLG